MVTEQLHNAFGFDGSEILQVSLKCVPTAQLWYLCDYGTYV